MSHVLDVFVWLFLYYGWYLNVSINEAFIDSVQTRKNILSIAKQLGYKPFRKTPATITVMLSFQRSQWQRYIDNNITIINLKAGTKFRDSKGMDWQLAESADLVYNSTDQTWQVEAKLYQGIYKLIQGIITYDINPKRFTRKIFDKEIANYSRFENFFLVSVETNTLDVDGNRIWENYKEDTIFEVAGPSDAVFFIDEYEDFIEFKFGDGIFGKKPTAGVRYEISYFTTKGSLGNGAKVFTFIDQITFANKKDLVIVGNQILVTLLKDEFGNDVYSSGGAEDEEIESIRTNAPKFYATKGRAVTTGDYATLIKSRGLSTWDISVWGGRYNIPILPNIFASAYFIENQFPLDPDNFDNNQNFEWFTQDIKDELDAFLAKYSSDSTNVIYVNPMFFFNEFRIIGFEQDLTINVDLRAEIDKEIKEYFFGNSSVVDGEIVYERLTGIQRYNQFFSFSRILQNIDNIDGLIDLEMEWKPYFRIFDWQYQYLPSILLTSAIPPAYDYDYWFILPEIELDSLSWTDPLSNQAIRSNIDGEVLYYTALDLNNEPSGTPEVIGQIDLVTIRSRPYSNLKFKFNLTLDGREFPIEDREVRFYFEPRVRKWQNVHDMICYLNVNDITFEV